MTRHDFWTWVQAKPQLKAILCGHTHIAEIDGFPETAQMYVVGGNYEGRGVRDRLQVIRLCFSRRFCPL